ncbi:hypothetical protein GCM10009823_20610 [Brevibacterium salitolerans]|uniref:Uncharacterized protein n=1 Tax=Brevibacterium salitolerans TaxID=1403566 RepID=A0ABN2WUF1_9MICO
MLPGSVTFRPASGSAAAPVAASGTPAVMSLSSVSITSPLRRTDRSTVPFLATPGSAVPQTLHGGRDRGNPLTESVDGDPIVHRTTDAESVPAEHAL